jgi:asparagine synthase (glutamine-hydrolysing)
MCGLAGILGLDGAPVSARELGAMGQALGHRGPDARRTWAEDAVGFAHCRLAILDLSAAGEQPMTNEDGSVQAVYNGQLFGFEPLRRRLEAAGHRFRSRTDTEVLVHLYEEAGPRLVEQLDGMFAFALWDARRRRLVLARDRVGIKPLYYAVAGRRLAFASEVSALAAIPFLSRRLDRAAVAQYLYLSSVPGSRPILEGVHLLPAGSVLVAEDGALRTERYWSAPSDTRDRPAAEAAAELRDRLGAAVRSHLVADVPVGAFLSGGLDSTAVVREMRSVQAEVQTFSVSFAGHGRFDEGPAARATAQRLGTSHHEVVFEPPGPDDLVGFVRAAGEPFAVASGLPLAALARRAREHVKVVLTGDGADELLAGYPWRHAPPGSPVNAARQVAMAALRSYRGARAGGPGLGAQLRGRLGRLPRPDEHYADVVSAFTPEELEALVQPGALDPRAAWEDHPVRRAFAAAPDGDEVNRRLHADLVTTLADEMLVKVDRMTMAHGLEARVPFLDREVVEWAMRLPGHHKVAGGTGKLVLRRALQDALPDVAARPKHGFDPPVGAWLRGPLRELMTDHLCGDGLASAGLFRGAAVEALVRAHLDGVADCSRKLFTLLVLAVWLRERGDWISGLPAAG